MTNVKGTSTYQSRTEGLLHTPYQLPLAIMWKHWQQYQCTRSILNYFTVLLGMVRVPVEVHFPACAVRIYPQALSPILYRDRLSEHFQLVLLPQERFFLSSDVSHYLQVWPLLHLLGLLLWGTFEFLLFLISFEPAQLLLNPASLLPHFLPVLLIKEGKFPSTTQGFPSGSVFCQAPF